MLQRCPAGHARRLSFVVLVISLGLGAVPAWSQAHDAAANALLTIDLNRATVIERIVMQWGALILPSGAVLDAEHLRMRLSGLRSDRLLAASLAGTPQGLQQVLSQAEATTHRDARLKSLGDTAVDLTYTPLTPCRIIDTRNAVGPLQPGVTRAEAGYTATTFAGQGGASSNCGIPAGVAALALNVVAVNPANLGFIKLWPANAVQPNASTINYDPTTINIATGTIVPVDGTNNNSFNAESPAQVQIVADVVGYFAAPSGTGGKFFMQGGNAFGTAAHLGTTDNQPLELYVSNQRAVHIEAAANATNAPNLIGGYANNAIYSGLTGTTIGGGGAPGAQDAFILPGNVSEDRCSRAFGCINGIIDSYGTIAGGVGNLAGAGTAGVQGQAASVGGGLSNWAYGAYSAVAGGTGNTASGYASAVPGGDSNSATGSYSVALGGDFNQATGHGTVTVGGVGNVASGLQSFAAGTFAHATAAGQFVWADDCCIEDFDPSVAAPYGWGANAENTFNARATGGIWFVTAVDSIGRPTWGCTLTTGAGWFCSSDRNLKRNLSEVDATRVLSKLVDMPVYLWQPRDGANAEDRHIGPMAQDFYATFGLGHTDTAIGFQDVEGVALAAIQGLHRLMQEKEAQIEAQHQAIADQQREIAQLRERMAQVDSLRTELDAVKHALLQLTSGAARAAMPASQ